MSNPYSAPGADLDVAAAQSYQPKFLTASGRIGRLRYLAYSFGAFMLMYVAMVPLVLLAGGLGALGGGDPSQGAGMGIAMMLLVAVMYVAILAVYFIYAKRRLNDLGKSGWLGALMLLPIVNLFLWIYIQFFPGDKGPNQYGPAPVANSGGVVALAVIMLLLVVLSVVGILAAVAIPAYQDYLQRANVEQVPAE